MSSKRKENVDVLLDVWPPVQGIKVEGKGERQMPQGEEGRQVLLNWRMRRQVVRLAAMVVVSGGHGGGCLGMFFSPPAPMSWACIS